MNHHTPPCFIVAELSANHNGSLQRAKDIVRAAAQAGANAVKLQTYTADTLTIPCDNEFFRIKKTLWEGRTLHELYQEATMPWEWTPSLMELARDLEMDCFSTPFDESAVDFLESCHVSRYKIASFELVDIPLLQKVGATGKPVIMSTGMATLAEIDEAVRTLRAAGTTDLTLLKCTSAYPAPPEHANLRTMPHLGQAFQCRVGLSDHTTGTAVAVAAVALGAQVVEKHLTLRRADGGPDGAFSMEPQEFAQLVQDIRTVEQALGCVSYELSPKEQESIPFRRSLCVVEDIAPGEPFTHRNVRSIRPSYGLHTRYLAMVLTKKARQGYAKGTPLTWDMLL